MLAIVKGYLTPSKGRTMKKVITGTGLILQEVKLFSFKRRYILRRTRIQKILGFKILVGNL